MLRTIDTKTPFDELSELRTVLTTQQIAELTGLRRETISRARPDSRFQSRTVKALADLYLVVDRLRPMLSGEADQLGPVLRRPQPLLADRSIAELLRDGSVEAVLEHLAPSNPLDGGDLEDLGLDPEIEAELRALEVDTSEGEPTDRTGMEDGRVSDLLGADRDLASRVDAIEGKIHDYFGSAAVIERAVIADSTAPAGRDHLYLGVRSDLPLDEEIDRLAEMLTQEAERLGSVQDRLTIGTL